MLKKSEDLRRRRIEKERRRIGERGKGKGEWERKERSWCSCFAFEPRTQPLFPQRRVLFSLYLLKCGFRSLFLGILM